MEPTRKNLIILIRNTLWWAIWADGVPGGPVRRQSGSDHMLTRVHYRRWLLARPMSRCLPSHLLWSRMCTSGISLLRHLLSGVSSGRWHCWWLLLGQQWESHLGRLTQFRIQIFFSACAIGIYFLCKRLELQSKIPPAGLGHVCGDPNGEGFWFIFITACTSWCPRNLTLLRACHHNTARRLRQFGCPWAQN